MFVNKEQYMKGGKGERMGEKEAYRDKHRMLTTEEKANTQGDETGRGRKCLPRHNSGRSAGQPTARLCAPAGGQTRYTTSIHFESLIIF